MPWGGGNISAISSVKRVDWLVISMHYCMLFLQQKQELPTAFSPDMDSLLIFFFVLLPRWSLYLTHWLHFKPGWESCPERSLSISNSFSSSANCLIAISEMRLTQLIPCLHGRAGTWWLLQVLRDGCPTPILSFLYIPLTFLKFPLSKLAQRQMRLSNNLPSCSCSQFGLSTLSPWCKEGLTSS